MTPDVIAEGLSRGVVAGIVRSWDRDARAGRWHVAVEGAGERWYADDEAAAFAEAVFAAERVVGTVLSRLPLAADEVDRMAEEIAREVYGGFLDSFGPRMREVCVRAVRAGVVAGREIKP